MNVIQPRNVHNALRTLEADERRTVLSWFDRLENWEVDEHVREMAKTTADRGVYDLNTPDDFRIFFEMDEAKKNITIMDLARPSRFKHVKVASE